MMAKIELPRLGTGGTSPDDLILLAAEGAAGGKFPTSPDAFRALSEKARGRWFESAAAIGTSLDEVLEILPDIRSWLARHRNDRNLGGIAEDIDEQLAWLFRPRFVWLAGYEGLRDYPRRLRAIRSRLGRISSLPIVKDLEKMERLRRLWLPWFRQWTATPEAPALWPVGWALEELRVSLFAPDVPCIAKVSEKRIAEMPAYPGACKSG
jgi:ATP-dependent helicase HrpA